MLFQYKCKMFMITFPPYIHPIAISIGPVQIYWYSFAYIAGILLGHLQFKRIIYKRNLFSEEIRSKLTDDLISYIIIGIIIGGRLGYVLFYDIQEYLHHPLDILKIWRGGMSFHGGLIGVIVAVYLLARKHKIGFFSIIDICAITTPIGLFFGRIANFINAELYGRVTDVPWGVIFPHSDNLPRHPSQLYEAFGEGIILYILLILYGLVYNNLKYPGRVSAAFLGGYSLIRIFIEQFREADVQIGYIYNLTLGQILCAVMLIISIMIYAFSIRKNNLI